MSETRELIREQIKTNRRTRFVNTILWIVITLLVCAAGGVAYYAAGKKIEAETLADELKISNDKLAAQKEELKISEENLQGEKEKLEEISVKYDSLRQAMLELENQDELWEATLRENTVQAYTDYIIIKGVNDNVLEKLNAVLNRTGYVQIQESNGNMLFERIEEAGELNIWIPKTARSVRNGVIGRDKRATRTGSVILKGQPVRIVEDSIYTGKARWAKIKY